jgi:hypothetical protein
MDTTSTDSSPASVNESTAATDSSSSPQDSAASAAPSSADTAQSVAASGVDATVANLTRQYRDNLLNTDDVEDGDSEVETPTPQPKVEAKPETVEEDETVIEPEVDPLAGQTGPRTVDDLKKQFPRSQTIVLNELAKVEARNWEVQQTIDSIGGKEGIEIALPIMRAIFTANPSAAVLVDGQPVLEADGHERTYGDELLDTLAQANPDLLVDSSQRILNHALTETRIDPASGLPINVATWNAMIKTHIDPDYTLDDIKQAIAWDKMGLIDREALAQEAELYTGKSAREQELEARLKAVEDRDKATETEKEQKTQAAVRERYEKAMTKVSSNIMGEIVPIAEHFGWTATKEELNSADPAIKQAAVGRIAFGRMLSDHMEAEKQRCPEWADIEHLSKTGQALDENGNPTLLFVKAQTRLLNRIKGTFKQTIREVNPMLAEASKSTRAAQLAKNNTRNGKVEASKIPPVQKVEPKSPVDAVKDTDCCGGRCLSTGHEGSPSLRLSR